MALYNLRSADGQWIVTKFDNDLNVESSYAVSESECACPAGSRPTCRHRQMLPKMLAVGAEDTPMFYNYDSDQFLEPIAGDTDIISPLEPELASAASESSSYLEGLSQTPTTTINSAAEVSSTAFASHRGGLSPHPAITGTLKRRI